MKKVLLVNGSPRRNGNTAAALEIMEKELLERGLETVWSCTRLYCMRSMCLRTPLCFYG